MAPSDLSAVPKDSPQASEFHRLQLITPLECRATLDRILALRLSWTGRGENEFPFFTLGVASYMDLAPPGSDIDAFDKATFESNARLKLHFPDLLEKVRLGVRTITGTEATFPDRVPLPGFHIWLEDAIPRSPTASIHFDLQYEPLVERSRLPRPQQMLSFTLPVRLPTAGGGLNVWNIDYRAPDLAQRIGDRSLHEAVLSHETVFLPYREGELLLHSGNRAHQIAPVPSVYPGDMRITLQGHGVLSEGRWLLYW